MNEEPEPVIPTNGGTHNNDESPKPTEPVKRRFNLPPVLIDETVRNPPDKPPAVRAIGPVLLHICHAVKAIAQQMNLDDQEQSRRRLRAIQLIQRACRELEETYANACSANPSGVGKVTRSCPVGEPADNWAMASPKATWEWRGKQFRSKAELVKHLKDRAREALQGVLGPPVSERSGNKHATHHVHFKVQVLLGTKPSRSLAGKAPTKPGSDRGRVKKSSTPSNADVTKEIQEYFG